MNKEEIVVIAIKTVVQELRKVFQLPYVNSDFCDDIELMILRKIQDQENVTFKAEPYGWLYECVRLGTDGKGWSEIFSRDEPKLEPGIRNIKALYEQPSSNARVRTMLTVDRIVSLWKDLGGDNYPAVVRFVRAVEKDIYGQVEPGEK